MQKKGQFNKKMSSIIILSLLLLLLLLTLLCCGMVAVNCAIVKGNTDLDRSVVKIADDVKKILNMVELKKEKAEKVKDRHEKRKRLNQFLDYTNK